MKALTLLLTVIALTALGGCDSSGPGNTGRVAGSVVFVNTGSAAESVLVVLAEEGDASPAATTLTDADGAYETPRIRAGRYWVWFLNTSAFRFYRSQDVVEVTAGERTQLDMELLPHPLTDWDYFITGTVTDAATGKPVSGALVGLWPTQSLLGYINQGYAVDVLSVSDAEGRYRVAAVVTTTSQGEPIGLFPVAVTHRDYEPTVLTGGEGTQLYDGLTYLPTPEEGSTLRADVSLHRLTAEIPTGSLRGRIVAPGAAGEMLPVAGVRVAADAWLPARWDTVKSGPDPVWMPGHLDTTDAEGEFLLAGLPAGIYTVEPAIDPGDGYLQQQLLDIGEPVAVEPGETADIGDMAVWPEVTLVSPAEGATASTQPTFVWEPLDVVDLYTVNYSGPSGLIDYSSGMIIRTPEMGSMSWTPAEPVFEPGQPVRWMVEAYIAPVFIEQNPLDPVSSNKMGESKIVSFTVAP